MILTACSSGRTRISTSRCMHLFLALQYRHRRYLPVHLSFESPAVTVEPIHLVPLNNPPKCGKNFSITMDRMTTLKHCCRVGPLQAAHEKIIPPIHAMVCAARTPMLPRKIRFDDLCEAPTSTLNIDHL